MKIIIAQITLEKCRTILMRFSQYLTIDPINYTRKYTTDYYILIDPFIFKKVGKNNVKFRFRVIRTRHYGPRFKILLHLFL